MRLLHFIIFAGLGWFNPWTTQECSAVSGRTELTSIRDSSHLEFGRTQDDAQLLYPIDVAVDSSGTVYVADRNLPGIWQIKDGKLSVFYKASAKFRTPLNAIRCIAVDPQDRVLAGCSSTTEVFRFENGTPVPLTGGQVSVPMNMSLDSQGRILVCDLKLRQLVRVEADASLTVLSIVQAPKAVIATPDDKVLVLTGVDRPLLRFNNSGLENQAKIDGEGIQVFSGDYTPAEVVVADRPFDFPADVAALPGGDWVVTDSYAKCLWRVSPAGEVKQWVTDERFVHPVGICSRGEELYVADSRAKAVFRVDADGTVTVVAQASAPAEDGN